MAFESDHKVAKINPNISSPVKSTLHSSPVAQRKNKITPRALPSPNRIITFDTPEELTKSQPTCQMRVKRTRSQSQMGVVRKSVNNKKKVLCNVEKQNLQIVISCIQFLTQKSGKKHKQKVPFQFFHF